VKPIIGMEAYVAPGGLHNKQGKEDSQAYHLLLLAKNEEGYRNLCRLHTVAALEGFYYKPRVDHALLRRHSKGLISSSTCLGSEINQYLLAGDYDKAQHTAGMYKEIFGAESYFIELQNHGLAEQKTVNEQLVKIAAELNLPLVATNDAHYLCKTDAEPHDVLLCIGTGSLLELFSRVYADILEGGLADTYAVGPFTPYPTENEAAIIEDVRQCKGWPVHREDLDMSDLVEMTRLQMWTLKPALAR